VEVLKRTGEKPYTIKVLQARLEEIEAARAKRVADREAEEARLAEEAREAQERAWREQQARAEAEQRAEEAMRERERAEHERFKEERAATATAKAEAEAEAELGFGLDDAWRYIPRAGTYGLFVVILSILVVGNFSAHSLGLQRVPAPPP